MNRIWQEIGSAAQAGTAVHEVQRRLFSELLKLSFSLLGYFFKQLGEGDQGLQVDLSDGRVLKHLEGLRERRYQSVFGEFN